MKGVVLAESERSSASRETAYNNWLRTLKTPDGRAWARGFGMPAVAQLLDLKTTKVNRMWSWLQNLNVADTESPSRTFEEISRLAMMQRLGRGGRSPATREGIKQIVHKDLQVHQADSVVIGGRIGPEWLRVINSGDEAPGFNSAVVEIINRQHLVDLSLRAVELALPTEVLSDVAPESTDTSEKPVEPINNRLSIGDLRRSVRAHIAMGGDWAELLERAGVPDELTGNMLQLLVSSNLSELRAKKILTSIGADPSGTASLHRIAAIVSE